MQRAGGTAGHAGGDHGLAQRLQRPRHVHALAARHRGLLDRAVAAAEPEVRHGERLVDRGVEGDGDDHLTSRSRTRTRRTVRRGREQDAEEEEHRQGEPEGRHIPPALYPLRAPSRRVTSGHAADHRARPPARSRVPTRVPARSGPSSSSGRRHPAAHALDPRRTVSASWRRGTSSARSSRCSIAAARHRRAGLSTSHAPEAVEPPAQQRERVVVARRLARLAEHDAHHPTASARSRPRPPARSRPACVWPVLTPVDERVARRSGGCGSPPRAGARPTRARACRRVDDAREAPVAHQPRGQRREVAGGRVAAGSSSPIGFA